MNALPVDIDAKTIQFDGRWMGREDLAKAIRQLLDAGNYAIGRHSSALEALSNNLAEVVTLSFRSTPELADALTDAAQKSGKTPGHLVREALSTYLAAGDWGAAALPTAAPASAPAPVEAEPATVAPPIAAVPPLPPPGLRPAQPGVSAGTGALRAASVSANAVVEQAIGPELIIQDATPEDAVNAVDLTPKNKHADGEAPELIERGWFGN